MSAVLIMVILTIWWIALSQVARFAALKRHWEHPDAYAAMAASLFLLVILSSTLSLIQSVYWIDVEDNPVRWPFVPGSPLGQIDKQK